VLSVKYAYRTERGRGDFHYDYTVEPILKVHSDTRINNASSVDNHFLSFLSQPGKAIRLRWSAQVYESRRGLPGPGSDQNRHAFREDDRVLLTASAGRELGGQSQARLDLGYSRFEQYFWDRATETTSPFETRFIDDQFSLRPALKLEPWRNAAAQLGAEYRLDRLDHRDEIQPRQASGVTNRTTHSAFLTVNQAADLSVLPLLQKGSLDGALRYDNTITAPKDTLPTYPWEPARTKRRVEKWSPHMGVALAWEGWASLVLRGNYGKSFRLPSINALFWKGDARARGNPDLRPELSEHAEGGFELGKRFGTIKLDAGVTWHRARVTDLVVWVHSGPQGVYKPINLGSALITGHEDFIRLRAFDGHIEVCYGNSINHGLNKVPGHNSYDKQLAAVPRYVTRGSIRFDWGWGYAAYEARWVDRRPALESNNKWYPGYRFDVVSAGISIDLSRRWKLHLDGALNNAFDEDYVLLSQHPMPGRESRLGLRLEYDAAL
jgi:outer membrane receptor protein involved in Fe transport